MNPVKDERFGTSSIDFEVFKCNRSVSFSPFNECRFRKNSGPLGFVGSILSITWIKSGGL